MEILVLSDNHGYVDKDMLRYASEADEVWHGGDWLTMESVDQIMACARVMSVYGNVDNAQIRSVFPLYQLFEREGFKILMLHIAGYPGRYNRQALNLITKNKPDLVVCGHSHILKIMKDHSFGHLHINPGASGLSGFHKKRTLVRFSLSSSGPADLRVIEYEK